ncbi:MAG: hypothetical protein K2Q12_02845 [Rickettsiales bacterium]|nr:hypothetical protein [Rickettsiales bacterium]
MLRQNIFETSAAQAFWQAIQQLCSRPDSKLSSDFLRVNGPAIKAELTKLGCLLHEAGFTPATLPDTLVHQLSNAVVIKLESNKSLLDIFKLSQQEKSAVDAVLSGASSNDARKAAVDGLALTTSEYNYRLTDAMKGVAHEMQQVVHSSLSEHPELVQGFKNLVKDSERIAQSQSTARTFADAYRRRNVFWPVRGVALGAAHFLTGNAMESGIQGKLATGLFVGGGAVIVHGFNSMRKTHIDENTGDPYHRVAQGGIEMGAGVTALLAALKMVEKKVRGL